MATNENGGPEGHSPSDLEEKPISWWLSRLSPKQLLGIGATFVSIVTAAAALGALANRPEPPTPVPGPGPAPIEAQPKKSRDLVSFGMRYAMLVFRRDGTCYTSASFTAKNTTPDRQIMVDGVRFGVKAISKVDGSILTHVRDLARNEPIGAGAIKPIDAPSEEIIRWKRMGQDVNERPTPATHWFSMWYQMNGDDGADDSFWLDVDADVPTQSNCEDGWCLTIVEHRIPVGRTPRRRCTIFPAGADKNLECFSLDSGL